MESLQEIETAILRLPKKDFSTFREWFEKIEAEAWDKKFEKDAVSGKFDRLAKKARDDFKAGKCKELIV